MVNQPLYLPAPCRTLLSKPNPSKGELSRQQISLMALKAMTSRRLRALDPAW